MWWDLEAEGDQRQGFGTGGCHLGSVLLLLQICPPDVAISFPLSKMRGIDHERVQQDRCESVARGHGRKGIQ